MHRNASQVHRNGGKRTRRNNKGNKNVHIIKKTYTGMTYIIHSVPCMSKMCMKTQHSCQKCAWKMHAHLFNNVHCHSCALSSRKLCQKCTQAHFYLRALGYFQKRDVHRNDIVFDFIFPKAHYWQCSIHSCTHSYFHRFQVHRNDMCTWIKMYTEMSKMCMKVNTQNW